MTDYMTLADARTWTAFLVDDTSNKRFSTTDIDIALKGAVAATIDDFMSRGMQQFTRFQSVTTDATGAVDLSSYDPRTISAIQLDTGGNYYTLSPLNLSRKVRKDSAVRNLEIAYVPRHTFPTTTTWPLIGSTTTSLGSWRAFDELCCCRAAATLLVRNNEINKALESMKTALQRTVMTLVDTPQEEDVPRRVGYYGDWLNWSYDHENQTAQILIDIARG